MTSFAHGQLIPWPLLLHRSTISVYNFLRRWHKKLVSFPRWCQESLKSEQQRMSLTSNPRPICVLCKCQQLFSTSLTGIDGMQYHFYRHLLSKSSSLADLRLFLFTTKQVNREQLPPTRDFVTRLWKVQTSSHWYGHKMKGPTRSCHLFGASRKANLFLTNARYLMHQNPCSDW